MNVSLRSALLAGIGLLNASAAFSDTINVVFFDDRFGTLNDATGAYAQIGTLPVSASSGIAWMNGTLYVENMGSDLYEVNPVDGSWSLIGATGLSTTAGVFAGTSDGLFEVDYLSNVYSLNPTTGRATLVGATGLVANNGQFDTSLSSDGTYLYYTAGGPGAPDELYQISTATGLATDLGSTGITGVAGSAFVNGNLELFQYGQSANYIYFAPDGSTDFTRGAQLSAQILDGGALAGSLDTSGSGEEIDTPEVASFLLTFSGLLAVWCLYRASASDGRSPPRYILFRDPNRQP